MRFGHRRVKEAVAGIVLRPCLVGDAGPTERFLELPRTEPRARWCGRVPEQSGPLSRSLLSANFMFQVLFPRNSGKFFIVAACDD